MALCGPRLNDYNTALPDQQKGLPVLQEFPNDPIQPSLQEFPFVLR